MSPEQARGLKVARYPDIFSFGIVLYEMIAGRSPFEGKTTADMMVSILDRQPTPISRYVRNAPVELERIISMALVKNRDGRHQLAKADVGRPEGIAEEAATRRRSGTDRRVESGRGRRAANTVEGFGLERFWENDQRLRPVSSGLAARALDSLAVLPFFTTSGDPNAAYLAEGIPESLIINLSRLSELRVMAWSTVVLAGGGRRPGDRARPGRCAIFAGRDVPVRRRPGDQDRAGRCERRLAPWGAQYRRKLDDLGAIEQELSIEICERLRIRLNEEERRRLAKRYTENAAAYQAYLKGAITGISEPRGR